MKCVSGQSQACDSGVQKWIISDSVQVASLISATNCFGGNFEVELNGRVQVQATIFVLGGTIMKITGSGDAFLDGGGNTQIFSVDNSELHLENVIVGNGNSTTDGGAIYSTGSTLSFIDTHFIENNAMGNGGAVHVSDYSYVTCMGSSFTYNTAYRGGAMYVNNNTIASCGGSWKGNFGENSAGAIRVGDGSILSWIEDTIFESNGAFGAGGAMVVSQSTVYWDNCTTLFHNNMVEEDGNSASLGGAIFLAGSNMSWSGTTKFDSNHANLETPDNSRVLGGAIHSRSDSMLNWGGVTSFTNNTSGHISGAIYLSDTTAHCTGYSHFENNAALDGHGDGLYIGNSNFSWDGEMVMKGHKGRSTLYTMVGDISSSSTSVTTFVENNGYVVYLGMSHAMLDGVTTISGNNGTAFLVASLGTGTLSWDGKMNISHNTDNAIYVAKSNVSWGGETEISNNMRGGIVAGLDSNITWKGDTTFLGNGDRDATNINTAGEEYESRGGAINVFTNSIVSWGEGHTKFIDNEAYHGGSIFTQVNSRVSWSGKTDFIGSSGFFGGVIASYDDSEVSWSGDTTFIDSTGYSGPGTIECRDSKLSWSGKTMFLRGTGMLLGASGIGARTCEVSWSGPTEFIENSVEFSSTVSIDGGSYLGWTGETNFTSNIGGAISVASSSTADDGVATLFINGSTVFFNNSVVSTGGAIDIRLEIDLTIDPSSSVSFIGNSASSGGAISVRSVFQSDELVFSGMDFIGNSAQVGGAIATFASNVRFEDCNFTNNTAITGGAINSVVGKDYISDCVFEGNHAVNGGALRLAGEETSIFGCLFLENASDEEEGPAVSNIGNIILFGDNNFSGNIYDCPSDTFLEVIESDHPYEVFCLGCDTECVNCIVEEHVPICTDTLEHSESYGGNTSLENIYINEGFWRASSSSRNVLQCHNEDACVGGVTGSDDYCEEGYEGPYCSICSEGYSEHLSFSCRECSDDNTDTIIAATILSVVGLIVVSMLAYYLTSSELDSNVGLSGVMKRYIPLQSLKIVVVTWQILNQFSSVANVVYPGIYQEFLDGLDFFNFDFSWIMSAGCVVRIDFHDRLLLSTICPIVALAFLACTYTIAYCVNRGKKDVLQRIDDKHMSMFLLLTFLVYSSVSSVLFKTFACENMDDDKYYLRADYRIECDSSEHASYQLYAGIMIIVYTLGIPTMYCYLLFRDRDVLKTSDSIRGLDSSRVEAISDLWKPYRSNVFYYEIVECIRRVLLSSVVVFIYPNTAAQIAITILISFSFVVIFEAMAPYVSSWDRWISRMGQVVIFISFYMALLLKVDVSGERHDSQEIFEETLIAVHVLMVLAVIIESIVTICYLKHDKVQDLDDPQPLPRFNVEAGLEE